MNAKINITESTADGRPAPSGITIIYEDRATGLRAKEFSDMLSASLGNGRPPSEPACWRLELIDLPGLADEVSRNACASEFLVLSLRGNSHLTTATKQWLELWLERVPLEATCLIALFDPIRSVAPHAEAARCYLRHVAAKAGVAFFAHCVVTPRESSCEREADDGKLPVRSKPCRRCRNIVTSVFPTALTASFLPGALAV